MNLANLVSVPTKFSVNAQDLVCLNGASSPSQPSTSPAASSQPFGSPAAPAQQSASPALGSCLIVVVRGAGGDHWIQSLMYIFAHK